MPQSSQPMPIGELLAPPAPLITAAYNGPVAAIRLKEG